VFAYHYHTNPESGQKARYSDSCAAALTALLRQAPKGKNGTFPCIVTNTSFETGPEEPELEDLQVEKKSKAAQTRPKKLIRRTCPSGHGSDGSGPKWHAPPCSESAAQPVFAPREARKKKNRQNRSTKELMFYATTTKKCLPRIFVRHSVSHSVTSQTQKNLACLF